MMAADAPADIGVFDLDDVSPSVEVQDFLQWRTPRTQESWADFGDELLLLVERAFPEFPEQARESTCH